MLITSPLWIDVPRVNPPSKTSKEIEFSEVMLKGCLISKCLSQKQYDSGRTAFYFKRYALNLNIYRNLDHQTNNTLKQLYKIIMKDQLVGLKLEKPYFSYKCFYKSRATRDKMNLISVVNKFFDDALVEYGCLPDDNDKYVGPLMCLEPEIDKENPRMEIRIYDKEWKEI